MSFASRRTARFNYESSPATCPAEFLGQSTFWQDQEPAAHSCTGRPARAYVAARPMGPMGQPHLRSAAGMDWLDGPQNSAVLARHGIMARGYFTEDEKRLMTLIGGGLIVALLVDAVAHSRR